MDKLHEYAAAIVHSIDLELEVEQSDENSFDYAEDLIRLNLRDDEDNGFMRHLKEKHGYADADKYSPMLWTILHEVGHSQTADEYSDEEYEEGLNTKLGLACCSPEELKTNEVLQDRYFDTAEEWYATEWAIDYLDTHRRECRHMSAELEALK